MPTYVYECAKCGDEVEAWQSFTDAPLKKHSGCGGKLSKVLQPVGIVFKGSGFHRTDSRTGGKRSRDTSGENGSSGDTASKDTKSDSSAGSSTDSTGTTSTDAKKPAKKPSAASTTGSSG
jgi:putative FmdB family regulatory protein